MLPDLLIKAIVGMTEHTTLANFQHETGMTSRSVALTVVDYMASRGIGTAFGEMLSFTGRDRLEMAILALKAGCDVEKVSQHLSWKDFEKLASEILSSLDYRTRANVRFTKPRMEIDVVGVEAGFAIAVDCKHWKRSNLSSISQYAKKQATRTKELVKSDESIKSAVPIILTLYTERIRFASGIPVVPIAQFKSFVVDVRGYLQDMKVIVQEQASR